MREPVVELAVGQLVSAQDLVAIEDLNSPFCWNRNSRHHTPFLFDFDAPLVGVDAVLGEEDRRPVPPLGGEGRQRAQDLVAAIGDEKITAIYSPDRGRNRR